MGKINFETFTSKMAENNMESDFSLIKDCNSNQINFLGFVPAPLKLAFKQGIENFISKYELYSDKKISCYIPSGHNKQDKRLNIWNLKNMDGFPDILISFGLDNLFKKSFRNLVSKGYFYKSCNSKISSDFSNLNSAIENDCCTIFSCSPYVLLIDKNKLGSLPVPKTWDDLFKAEYRNNIIVDGSHKYISSVILHYTYKEHGEEGLKKLAQNTKDIWFPAKMAKLAGTSYVNGAAIYVIPWFFAECCSNIEETSIIWPDDGSLIYPLYMLIKKSSAEKFKDIIDYITGENFGNICSSGYCPSLNSNVNNMLPKNSSFKWLGWEYTKSNNNENITDYLTSTFIKFMHT